MEPMPQGFVETLLRLAHETLKADASLLCLSERLSTFIEKVAVPHAQVTNPAARPGKRTHALHTRCMHVDA